MSEPSQPPPEPRSESARREVFRWQSLVHHAQDALFLLNQQRRILSVNAAWEKLTGLQQNQVHGLVCTRRPPAEPGAWDALLAALCPPTEVMEGRPGRVRRRLPAGAQTLRWWDIDFFPMQDGRGRLRILGKIVPVSVEETAAPAPLPERLIGLREKLDLRFTLDQLDSRVLSMRRVVEQVKLAGQGRFPYVLVGEAGAGKEWIARSIHHQGEQRERYFAALDCGRLPAEALETALFGEGSILLQPSCGTLYLKDVVALPRDLQGRLLDFLESNPTGIRVAAGCRVDPAMAVRAGQLLDRFHCVLSTLVIAVPPLRERLEDLPRLTEAMLARLNVADVTRKVSGLTPPALDKLRGYAWPENLRELYAVLAGARARTATEVIDVAELPAFLHLGAMLRDTPGPTPEKAINLDSILETVERRLILLALKRAGGNKSRAAELLSIWRPRLLRRLENLGIDDGKPASSDTPGRIANPPSQAGHS